MTGKKAAIIAQYRSSARRCLLALILAPSLLALPLLLILLLVFNLGSSDGHDITSMREQARAIGVVLIALIGGTVVFGLPAWILLRAARRESDLTYGLAGLAEGLFAAFCAGYSGSGPLRLYQAIGFGLLGLAGGAIAWTFWRIARVRIHGGIACVWPNKRQNGAADDN